MDTVSATIPGINPGPGSVVSTPHGRIEPGIPIDPIDAGPADWIPQKLTEQDPIPVVFKIFPYLDTFARNKGQACVWESYRSMGRKLGLCDGSIRRGLDCMDALGWTFREVRDLDGEERTFIWCRWLLGPAPVAAPVAAPIPEPLPVVAPAPAPVKDEDRYEYLMPGGRFVGLAEMESKSTQTPRVQSDAPRARSGATRARAGAARTGDEAVILRFSAPEPAQPAPVRAHRHINGNGMGTGSDSGGQGSPEETESGSGRTAPSPEQVNTGVALDPAEPPPLPDLKPEEVETMIADLRKPLRNTFDLMFRRAFWANLHYRGLLPADLAESLPAKLCNSKYPLMPTRESLQPTPEPERKPATLAASPAPAVVKTPTMLDRLKILGDKSRSAEDREADVQAIAFDLANLWGQASWIMGFAERLRRVVAGRYTGYQASQAFGRASSHTAENPGKVFMAALDE